MKKQINRNYYRRFLLGSVGMLMLLAAGLVTIPELDNDSLAVTCTDGTTGSGAPCATADTDINVNISEVLSISSITIDANKYCADTSEPGCTDSLDNAEANFGSVASGALSTKNVTVTADTNSTYGYQMQLEGVKTVTDATVDPGNNPVSNTDLIRSNDAGTPAALYYTIKTLTADTPAETFPEGRWGYKLAGATNYSAIPATATPVATYNWEVSTGGVYSLQHDTTFTFGVKPTGSQFAGTYEAGVRFTVVANSGS